MEKTFDAAEAEARLYKAWQSAQAFAAGANASREETYCIMIPPPNVTGALHVGHAFNNTLQDILVRWHRMRGFDTLWQPGQDHAGIATQLQVEKMLAAEGGPTRAEMGREAFVAKVWEWKEEYGSTIINQLQRLGASCDWNRNAFTMDKTFHDAVLKVFVDLYNKGLIYRGKRLVNWDPHFETAISDLEVENIEIDGHMWHFKYPLAGGAEYEYVEKDENGNVTLREMRNYISIATTRPETMLGDGAVAVHPDDERYAPIVGKLCEIPVGPKAHRRLIPIITDTYPVMDFGSGAVKITGAHDLNDYGVAKRNNIPMYRLMDTRAHMRNDGAPYAETAARAKEIAEGAEWEEGEIDSLNLVPDELRGLERFEARDYIVKQITADGLAVMTEANDPNTSPPSSRLAGRRKRKEMGVWQGPENEIYVCDSLEEALLEASTRYPQYRVELATSEKMEDGVFYRPDAGGEQTIVYLHPAYPYVENKKIMQPFCDRSKVVMEPMLTDQWYVDAEKLAGPAREAVRDGRVKIMPESGEKVYFHWMENIEPWCISRQLWWGHQIPVWYGPGVSKDGHINYEQQEQFCAASFAQAAEQAKAAYGADEVHEKASFSAALEDQLEGFAADGKVISLWRDPDVLDTWFSSGLWPIGTLGWPDNTPELQKYFPTSDLITGQDILFFWVARMIMMQLEVVGEVPFDTVYLHQLVRDEKGVKMSKTLGNVIDPLEMIDAFGADAVRFTMTAMAAIGGTLKLSMERVKGYRNFGTKIWNAARFAEMNAAFGAEATDRIDDIAAFKPQATANRWIIGEVARARQDVDAALAAYRFNDAASTLYAFVWGKVCDWYVEFSKPLLNSDDAALIGETRATMNWVLDQCLILLHPIMPFVTEELWGKDPARAKMLVHADWPAYTAATLLDAQADREMNWVIALIEAIRSARTQMHVPAGLKIPMLQVELDDAGHRAWANNETLIRRMARIDSLELAHEVPKGAITVPVQGGTFALPLADIIDINAEKSRLEKTLGKLEKEIGGMSGRLNNPKFVASAPAAVVDETRQNLAARQDEAVKLQAALARLDALI